MKKLKLNSDTVRTLTSAELTLAAGGVNIYTGGDETVGRPGCESTSCPGTLLCPGTNSQPRPTCTDPWPQPPP